MYGSQTELYHYGVKGMKWGVRRYQNSDGSLTDAGKERYYTDDERKSMYEHAKSHVSLRSSSPHFGLKVTELDDISEAGKFLKKQSDVVSDNYNKFHESYKKDLANLGSNKAFINACKKELDHGFGRPDMIDDDEFFELELEDVVRNTASEYLSASTHKAADMFRKSATQYANNVKAISEDIVGRYGDYPVSAKYGSGLFSKKTQSTYKSAVENSLNELGGTAYVKYLYNNEAYIYDEVGTSRLMDAVKKEWGYK